jgi:radical SAM/Cys-rich protein
VRVLSLRASGSPLADPAAQRDLLDRLPGRTFESALDAAGLWPLAASGVDVLQINVGRLCNQTCRHCHVDAGPDRREVMSRATMEQCLRAAEVLGVRTVDITGGAPELNPHFRWLVEQYRSRGAHVIDRCNLTIIETAAHADLPEFFAAHRVELVCSLPHYRALLTDRQRGADVYARSIAALQRLNAVGYGDGTSGLRLALVTNPVGAMLPASQASLEAEWKRELLRLHGVRFDALYCLANMPISRYLDWLLESGNLDAYMERLAAAFNPVAAGRVMCRSMLSVAWDGRLHDCDFNQMLEIGLSPELPQHVGEIDARVGRRLIALGRHCFGCTAGAGSSCGGTTV